MTLIRIHRRKKGETAHTIEHLYLTNMIEGVNYDHITEKVIEVLKSMEKSMEFDEPEEFDNLVISEFGDRGIGVIPVEPSSEFFI